MRKVNLAKIAETEDKSPKGKYHSFYKGVSLALGRDDTSRDLDKRHPFDLEYMRLPAGAMNYPYHAHSAQWELYVIVSGLGLVRHEEGQTEVGAGDAFTAEMVMGLLQNKNINEVNTLADEVARYVCSCDGATPPLPKKLSEKFAVHKFNPKNGSRFTAAMRA